MADHLNESAVNELAVFSAQLARMEKDLLQLRESRRRRLTIPAIFGRSGDENFISDYLAYILDPERNGIGTEPLQALLGLALEDISEIDFGQVAITREYAFQKRPEKGRIDFLIELGQDGENGVIAIENKIYSPEGEHQTGAYVEGVQGDYPGRAHYLLFLTPNGYPPKAKEFIPVSYADLASELRKIQFPVLTDIHKTVIWEDFIEHLEEYIVMANENLELSGRARLYLDHHAMIETLTKAYQDDAQKVFDAVTGRIMEHFGDGWHYHFLGRNGFQEINRESWKIGNYYVFYQYFFSRETLLTADTFGFMLGVWPKNTESRRFYEWLKSTRVELKELCQQGDIEYAPERVKGSGGYVIANKDYPSLLDPQDLSGFHLQFLKALDEFSRFTPIIDEAIQQYGKQ